MATATLQELRCAQCESCRVRNGDLDRLYCTQHDKNVENRDNEAFFENANDSLDEGLARLNATELSNTPWRGLILGELRLISKDVDILPTSISQCFASLLAVWLGIELEKKRKQSQIPVV